jgi:hypothetical protein
MADLHLSYRESFILFTAIFSEFIAFLFYVRFYLKLRKLSGSGRMNDIELATNWKGFFRVMLVIVPVLLYWFWSSSIPG